MHSQDASARLEASETLAWLTRVPWRAGLATDLRL
jgi:hypothetical protein